VGERSEQKKKHILETARKVFMERGYKDVTMKDIVDACGISRGGLYLYYPGTSELFLDVLRLESAETDEAFASSSAGKAGAAGILRLFFDAWKSDLKPGEQSLARATYEFAFVEGEEGGRKYLKDQFDASVALLSRIIAAGNRKGRLSVKDPEREARSTMYALEGLRISVCTMDLPEQAIDDEIDFLMSRFSAGGPA
jgi:AcrR family transcriptional regulator